MRQQDIAEIMEVSTMTISNIEKGHLGVADDKYQKYAQIIGKGDLFGIEDELKKQEQLIMEELRHSEDIIEGNPEMAANLLDALTDIDMFLNTKAFATFLSGRIAFVQKKRKKQENY